MTIETDHTDIAFDSKPTCVTLESQPSMFGVLFKAAVLGLVRSGSSGIKTPVPRQTIILKRFQPDPSAVLAYRKVCGFPPVPDSSVARLIPISYFQALFVSLFGRFITSNAFPLNPLGLIHIFQSFHQMRPVTVAESLVLSCTLSRLTRTAKGIESTFTLDVHVGEERVWQGISIFLTKSKPTEKKEKKKRKKPVLLNKKETIPVPAGTGRKYAGVSGDCNPHHMADLPAKLFGFKKAIAHGMWSLARVMASLAPDVSVLGEQIQVEAHFKRPIFMPAVLALGIEEDQSYPCQPQTHSDPANLNRANLGRTNFELTDDKTGIPHLKGHILKVQELS